MRKLLAVVALSLTACSVIPSTFDNVGYNNMVALKYQSHVTQDACPSSDTIHREVVNLNARMKHVLIYVNNANEDTALTNSINILDKVVTEFSSKYEDGKNPGAIYCTLKMQIINYNIDTIVSTVGSRQK